MKIAFPYLGIFAALIFVSLWVLSRGRRIDRWGNAFWRARYVALAGFIVGISGWGCSLGVLFALWLAQ
jgi:hypothetical protein